VGTIASAVVRGLLTPGGPQPAPKFVLSPRGAAKASQLASEFPDAVQVAGSNQEVVDAAECVIVAVLPKQGEEVLSALRFRSDQKVLSLIATIRLAHLKELIAPATQCAIGVPLPAVARRQGASLLIPPSPFAETIFNCLGTCVPVEDEAQFKRMQAITSLMGDFYKRQATAQEWLESNGVHSKEAAKWVGASFATMAADSATAGPDTFKHLVAEQTPGGLNEMVWKGQEEDGNYLAIQDSLDFVHHRLITSEIDASLAPRQKRAKRCESA